jgi:ThiF family
MIDELLEAGHLMWCLPEARPVPRDSSCALTVDQFSRVRAAYDLPVMTATRVVAVGCGGSVGFLEDIARAGVGEFVLVDPDVVERPNLATQHVRPTDIGRAKVLATAERVVEINPAARVLAVRAPLDELCDQFVGQLTREPWRLGVEVPTTTLLCGFSDDFWTQARVNRLALHWGVPQLSATVYREGRGAELVFTAPGVTPACARCALRSRYTAYVEQGYVNSVGSHGAPLWATSRLNALKVPIALALIHGTSPRADPRHPATRRYRRLLDLIAQRNLVLARLDPDAAATLGLAVFADDGRRDPRHVTEDVVWLRQEPDSPATGWYRCADCGGTGDLRDSIGRFHDTRPTASRFGEHRGAG